MAFTDAVIVEIICSGVETAWSFAKTPEQWLRVEMTFHGASLAMVAECREEAEDDLRFLSDIAAYIRINGEVKA